jgi:hypothetical protein
MNYEVTSEYVRIMLRFQGIPVPDDEIENIRLRLSLWFQALNDIEDAVGEQMNEVDPVPPVYPHEEF